MLIRKPAKQAFILCLLAASALLAMGGVAQADAPWWHIATLSAPKSPKGTTSSVLLDIQDVGDTGTPGSIGENVGEFVSGESGRLVTIVDKLPAGVTPTAVHPEGDNNAPFFQRELEGELQRALGKSLCSIEAQTVKCTYIVPIRPYDSIMFDIDVNVTPGAGKGENEASVSGAGSVTAQSRSRLSLEASEENYGVQSYALNPEQEDGAPDTQAGSHPFQLTSTLMFNAQTAPVFEITEAEQATSVIRPAALTKDLRFNLPPGLIGNPTALPKCSTEQFLDMVSGKGECPNNTVVGVATPIAVNPNKRANVPYVASGGLFSIEPSVGEPAKFAFLTSYGPVILDTSVRTGGDYGVVVTVPNITEGTAFIGSVVTFWGVPSDPRHNDARNYACLQNTSVWQAGAREPEPSCPVEEAAQPLLIMPTACEGAPKTTIEADPWSEIGHFTSTEYTFANSAGEPSLMNGCNRLNFEPSIKVSPDGQEASTPTGLSVNVHVPQEASLNPEGLAESSVRNTTVTLPAGVALNPAGADGLSACSLEQVALESASEQECPESAKVATLEIHTPLLPHPLVGAAYLAQQNANPFGSLVALYLVAKDPYSGVIIKLAGEVKPDPVTGQLVSIFKNTPELPFEDLVVHFFGGSRAPLGTPAQCGSYTTTASIVPWSSNATANSSSEFLITSGPNHTPCSAPLPFAPELTTGSLNIQAGAFTQFDMTMSREDGNQNLDAIQLKMPPGLSGLLTGVKLCGEAEGNAGTCGQESLIGETTVSVGMGGNPYTVKGGKVYITGPYRGAPFGLSIVNPAKAGPFDLGEVVVRAKIEVDPVTAALTITSDSTGPYAIPQIIDGIPLEIKHVNVTINRPNFTFNPTDCQPMSIGGDLTSSQGATSALHVPFEVTNCATLGFKPGFKVSTAGRTSRIDGASLDVKLTYPKAPFGSQANIKSVKVDLPKQLPSRLTTLQKACPDSTFDANPATCPAASRVGSAIATTPLVPVPLAGPAYFVSHGGAKFPELIVVLSGYGVTLDLHGETFINKAGITSSTFRTVPDAPVGTFELTLPEGPDSALAANGNLCTASLRMPTTFVAQNGVTIHQSTPIGVSGCKSAIHVIGHSVNASHASIRVTVPSAGTLLATGKNIKRSVGHVARAGTATIGVTLTGRGLRVLAKNPHQRINAKVKLSFSSKHGALLRTYVRLLMG